jgi:large subunit ribosomal protein L1
MDNKSILDAVKKVREGSKKRNFKQSIDFIVNLTNVDMKTLKLADSVELPSKRGKPVHTVVVADGEPSLQAKTGGADVVITKKEISTYDKKKVRELAKKTEWFIVQAPLMQPFAAAFGAILGPRGKMPLPKDVLGPTSDPTATIKRLANSTRIRVKDRPIVHAFVGTEEMTDEELVENILALHHAILAKLEKGTNSLGSMYLKTTMGAPVEVK